MRWGAGVQRDDAAISKGCGARMQASTVRVVDDLLDGHPFDPVAASGAPMPAGSSSLPRHSARHRGPAVDRSMPEGLRLAELKVGTPGLG